MPTTVQPELPDPNPVERLTGDAWQKAFAVIIARAALNQIEYPPGFECDVSRDAIYEEQLRSISRNP